MSTNGYVFSRCGMRTFLAKFYATAKQFTLENAARRVSPQVVATLDKQFHTIFTFGVAFIPQMAYLIWVLSGRSDESRSWFSLYLLMQLHLTVVLLGNVAIRCFVAYLILDEHPRCGANFDYSADQKQDGNMDKQEEKFGDHESALANKKYD